jgi:dipeptidyl-peptidase-4
LNSGKITQITQHGVKNKILNGLADWVYEEEFGHARQYEWTKNSDAIVFVKSDETKFRKFIFRFMEKRFIQAKCVTNIQKQEKNSVVSAHIYQLSDGKKTTVNLDSFKIIIFRMLFRQQNRMKLF